MSLTPKPRPNKNRRSIVFVTFESEFAPWGGLTAVMKKLPRIMARYENNRVFTVTPFFRNISRCNERLFGDIVSTGIRFSQAFEERVHEVELFVHTDGNGYQTFLVKAPGFFESPCDCGNPPDPSEPCNPYMDPSDPGGLVRDALFFSVAVPGALRALGRTRDLVVNLQDWETAFSALSLREEPAIESVSCILTLHNPYDTPITDSDTLNICSEPVWGSTALSKTLWFLDGPVCTVSENFAAELTSDPLHTRVYAPHLQDLFHRRGLVGINNGLFEETDFPADALQAARNGNLEPLLREKSMRRKEVLDALMRFRPREAWGTLDLEGFEGPIFLFTGRDDPRQKGYDVSAAAVQRLAPGTARCIFAPMPGEEGLDGLAFLKRLAVEQRPGEVLVFPFRMESGLYRILQRGSTFLVMCSLYEPFGGATEGYAVGTPVICRATGGLLQQVVPRWTGSLSGAARREAARFHPGAHPPTGFLFREPDLPLEDRVSGWQAVVDCAYRRGVPMQDRVEQRLGIRLFRSIVQEAAWTFQDAARFYNEERLEYGRMIVNGFQMLDRFSWESTVREYQRVFDQVCEIS